MSVCIHALSLGRVLEILKTPDVERISSKPVAKLKADKVYVSLMASHWFT